MKSDTARPFFERFLKSLKRPPSLRAIVEVREAKHAIELCHSLLSERGEVSGGRLALEVLTAYQQLDDAGREAFFDLLAEEFSPDPKIAGRAAETYSREPSQENLLRLQTAIEAPSQELFRRINMAVGGTGVLVQMRAALVRTLPEHPKRLGIDADLAHLFRSWFNRGFLVLQRIDFHTSALILERLIQYEAVHQIQGWRDLRRRLAADRRCYAFFHPALPDEPLIFIEIALARGMAAKVQPLLDPESPVVDPKLANCAIFYSITNCQEGLRGVSFGNFLIKQVAEDLGREFAKIKTFTTLSPIPGFRKWLVAPAVVANGNRMSAELAAWLTQFDSADKNALTTIAPHLRTELIRLCARYLLDAKHGQHPLDPVARFHLANGARLEHLNWQADTSDVGILRSLGLMAHYVYRLPQLDRNHEAYARDGRIIASHEVLQLAKPGKHVP